MKLARLFNVTLPTREANEPIPEMETRGSPHPAGARRTAPARARASGQGLTVSSFVNPQSLASFPGASFVVALLTQTIRSLNADLRSALWIPFVVSLVVGSIVFLVSLSDENSTSRPTTTPGWIVAIFIAFVNSIVLYLAAIGAIQTVAGKPAATAGG